MQVIVYGQRSSRLDYLIEVFCTDYFGFRWELTDDLQTFKSSNGFKLNYSNEEISDALQVLPSGFMAENEIRKFCPTHIKNDEQHELFPNASEIGFDVLSALFYVLSRYEEYVIEERDHHGRFSAQQSMAYHNGFLNEPVVDQWLNTLKKELERLGNAHFPAPKNTSVIIPSFDLDNAYAFVGKGFGRNLGGLFKDLLTGKLLWVKRRLTTWRNRGNDPYNTYDYILEKIENHRGIFFLPLGRRGPFDKNVRWKNVHFKSLVKRIAEKHEIGLHPSYNSNYLINILELEVKRFKKLNKMPVLKSRQHYLKLSFPETYQNLIGLGVKHDYTMGYADQPGFRAGIARSFPWYDLSTESTTELRIHPFMYMDGTFNDYMKISVEEAIEIMQELKQKTTDFGGEFNFIWHNDSLRNTDNWTGWRKLFEASL